MIDAFIKENLKEIKLTNMPFLAPFMGMMPKWKEEDPIKILDYDKIKKIINNPDNGIIKIVGGLAEDWECTKFEVYNNIDKNIKSRHGTGYDLSKWATPAIQVFTKTSIKSYECWMWEELNNGKKSNITKQI